MSKEPSVNDVTVLGDVEDQGFCEDCTKHDDKEGVGEGDVKKLAKIAWIFGRPLIYNRNEMINWKLK